MSIELPNEQKNRKTIFENHSKTFNACKTIWNLALMLLEQGAELHTSPNLNVVLSGIWAKQLRLFYSTYRLCEVGLGNEALLPLRASFETLVKLKYLKQEENQEEFAYHWMLWDYVNKEKVVMNAVSGEIKNLLANDEISLQIRGLKLPMTPPQWKKFIRQGPFATDKLNKLSDKVRLSNAYRPFYSIASAPAHCYDLAYYAKRDGSGNLSITLPPNNQYIAACLCSATAFLHNSSYVVNNMLKLSKDRLIIDLKACSTALMTEYREQQAVLSVR